MMTRTLAPIVTIVLVLIVAPAASAARRYATPTGSTTSADCAVSDPCRIDRAINGARAGDEVIVASGEHEAVAPLRPSGPLDIHGDPDRAWPRIRAATVKETLLVLKGGTLTHVSLEAAVPDQQALVMQSGVAGGIHVTSAAGPGATVLASAAGTIVRNSIVSTLDPRGGTAALTVEGGKGTVALRNLTVMAGAGSATGLRCDVKDGTASLVNTLVRGEGGDIDADGKCTAAFSNFRPAFSSGLALGAGNQSAEPLFADGAYRPAAGSPTIDAGALDAFASSPDPDGRPRALGTAPDIGAYEFAPVTGDGGPSGELPDDLKGVPLPKQGRSVVVAPARGTIRIRRPGTARFTALDEPGRIPVGSVIDARRGRVELVSAIDGDRVQTGLFWGSKFKTSQRRTGRGMTTLTLRGGNLAACPRTKAHGALAVASRKRKRQPRRSLWARDHGGRFRTHGHDSVATARGTAWLTQDRCSGTLTRVIEGSVSVRDLVRHKRVLVKAGHSYRARRR
jgi:hypothetical protein